MFATENEPGQEIDIRVIGRHHSLMRQFQQYQRRQFYLRSVLAEDPPDRLPELVVMELPRLKHHCTAKYRAVENLVSTFDQTKTNLIIFLQMPIQTRKVPDNLLKRRLEDHTTLSLPVHQCIMPYKVVPSFGGTCR